MRNSNILSLFSNLSNNSPINYSDYNLIKTGSYKKLLKAHYAQDSNSTSKSKSTSKKTDTSVKNTTASDKLSNEAKKLKETVNTLSDKNLWKEGTEEREKIISSVKDFASAYNTVISDSSSVKSSDVSKSAKWMQSLTGVMSNTLARAGVNVSLDGTLSVDEDKMKKADLNTIKSLFSGVHSYADEISGDATSIANAAAKSNSLYKSDGTLQTSVTNFFDQGF